MKKIKKIEDLNPEEIEFISSDQEVRTTISKIMAIFYSHNSQKLLNQELQTTSSQANDFHNLCQSLKELFSAKGFMVKVNDHYFYSNLIYKLGKKMLEK